LLDIGLVEKIVTTPTKYNPVSIMDAVKILRIRRKKEHINLSARSKLLIKAFEQNRPQNVKGEVEQFVLIQGIEAIERKLQNLLEKTCDNVSIMVPWHRMNQWVTSNYDIINKALKRNVLFRVITNKPENLTLPKEVNGLTASPYFEVRSVATLGAWLRIYDGNEVMLTTTTKPESANYFAILSNNPCLIEIAQFYFESAWDSAVNLNPINSKNAS
jgi:sugar-specific transcriptional regulator TrmB